MVLGFEPKASICDGRPSTYQSSFQLRDMFFFFLYQVVHWNIDPTDLKDLGNNVGHFPASKSVFIRDTVYIPHFVYPFIHLRTFGLFLLLAIGTNAAMNVSAWIFLWETVFNFGGHIPWSRTVGSFNNSILRNCHAVFYSGCTSWHSHQHGGGFHFCTYWKYFILSAFLVIIRAILWWYDVVFPLSVTVVW